MMGSHHQPAAAEEKYACTRYCTWVHLFGNAYQCHTHNQLHVCDQNCRQLVPATATTSVCRLSKVGGCISHGRSHALTLSLALRASLVPRIIDMSKRTGRSVEHCKNAGARHCAGQIGKSRQIYRAMTFAASTMRRDRGVKSGTGRAEAISEGDDDDV